VDVGKSLRAVRAARRLSQRELAAAVGVPRSTIDRIEAGRTDPRMRTYVRIVEATGYRLVVADRFGRVLCSRTEREQLFDRAARRFPAHLESGPTPDYFDQGPLAWWGWHHIAFPLLTDNVPENTYWRRGQLSYRTGWDVDQFDGGRIWDDAT
jgi:transcriptional regulator with XRE-family HTH domain